MPMREYVCAPRNRSRRVYWYVLGCVLLATALWIVPALTSIPYGLIFHFLAMVSLTEALLLTVRYLLRRYVYRFVATEDGGFDFVVTEISGKQAFCVCRVSTDAFRAIVREERGRAPRKKKDVGAGTGDGEREQSRNRGPKRDRDGKCARPTYDWSVGYDATCYLLTLIDDDEITVRISPDRDMVAMIEYSLRSPL